MKHIITIFVIIAAALAATAQTTQSGYVKTKGRMDSKGQLIPGTRLGGAAITLTGGRSTVSGTDGTFNLAIPDKKFYLQNVQKQGYQIVDPEVLKKQYVCSANPLVITMETPDKQLEDQLKSERKLRRTLQQQLQRREQEIDSLKENNKITEEEYRQALQKLYADQESNEKLISDMAKRYAEVDYDLLDEFYRQVTFCIENGDLVRADSLLRSRGDVRQQVEAFLQEEQVIQAQKEQLQKAEEVHAADKEELARRCYSYYKKLMMEHQRDSAAFYIELRASLDTTNVEWQADLADGLLKVSLGYRDSCKAISYIERALLIFRRLAIEDPRLYKPRVARALCRLAYRRLDHRNLRVPEISEMNFREAIELYKQLLEEDPLNDEYVMLYNDCIERMVVFFHYEKRFADAETLCVEKVAFCNHLAKRYPQLCEEYVSYALAQLARFYIETQRYDEAEATYMDALEIRRRLYEKDTVKYAYSLSDLLGDVAILYYDTKRFQEADALFTESLLYYKSSGNYRRMLRYKNAIAYRYAETGDYEKAIETIESAITLIPYGYFEDLSKTIANLYDSKGEFVLRQGNDQKALELWKKVLEIDPDFLSESDGSTNLYEGLKKKGLVE